MSNTIRDAIFAKAPKFRSKIINVLGQDVEVRQPSIGVRKEIFSKSKDKDGSTDIVSFSVWSVIKCSYIPNTEDHVFLDADFQRLLNEPPDSFFNELSEGVMDVMNMDESKKK